MKRTATVSLLNLILFTTAVWSRSVAAVAQSTTQAPVSTSRGTTVAPSLTDAPDTPWWILILFAVGIVILLVAFAMKGSKKKAAGAVPSSPNWKDHARNGYSAARWMYDAMDEDLAAWRGNTQYAETMGSQPADGTSRAGVWNQLDRRMSSAIESLYALEASAPDRRAAQTARNAVTALQATRDALDARAASRFNYRGAEAQSHDASNLMQAREREVRSSRNLVEARNALALALTDLSAIT